MAQLLLDASDDLLSALKKIKAIGEKKIEIQIPQDSFFSNLIALKLLKQEAEKEGKEIIFQSDLDNVNNLIGSLEEGSKTVLRPPEGFVRGRDIADQKNFTGQKGISRKVWLKGSSLKRIGRSKIFITFSLGSALVIFAVLGLGIFYLNVPTATVQLKVKGEVLVKTLEVTASPSAQGIDKEKRVIGASLVELIEKASQATKTTGRNIVGEKAKGEVVIYNKTDEKKRFEDGTKIVYGRTEGEDLIFLLDEKVTVPERVASVSSTGVGQSTVTYMYGKKTADVTAEKIGDEYNLKGGKTFTVEDFSTSSYIAQNEEAFSGGSSREIETVTAEDQERLIATLSAQLKDKALTRIKNENQESDLKLEDKAVELAEVSRNFDKQVGDEAEEVTLYMEMKALGYLYSESDLNTLLAAVLKDLVPEHFDLSDQEKKVSIEDIKIENNQLKFLAKVKGDVVPKINIEKLRGDIAGKKVGVVETYLASLTNIESYEIRIFPRLPGPFGTLPRKKERITINITHAQ